MLSKVTRKNNRLADDIRESLREASNYFSGKTTKAIVHRVSPKETETCEAPADARAKASVSSPVQPALRGQHWSSVICFDGRIVMLTNSRDIVRRLEQEGWAVVRIVGSHHVFKSPVSDKTVVVPHPNKDLGKGLVHAIYKGAGWQRD